MNSTTAISKLSCCSCDSATLRTIVWKMAGTTSRWRIAPATSPDAGRSGIEALPLVLQSAHQNAQPSTSKRLPTMDP